jgi:hypothetical protein
VLATPHSHTSLMKNHICISLEEKTVKMISSMIFGVSTLMPKNGSKWNPRVICLWKEVDIQPTFTKDTWSSLEACSRLPRNLMTVSCTTLRITNGSPSSKRLAPCPPDPLHLAHLRKRFEAPPVQLVVTKPLTPTTLHNRISQLTYPAQVKNLN